MHDVIVVGAGFAGLAAARVLTEGGRQPLVVEARARIGGRAITVPFGGHPVDMGAAWVHGVRGNPVAAVARAQGRPLLRHRAEPGVYDASIGSWLTSGHARRLYRQSDRLLRSRRAALRALGAEASWAQGVDWILEHRGITGVHRDRLRAVLEQSVELDYAGPAGRQSLAAVDEDEAFGGPDVFVEGGFGPLLASVAKGLEVRLDTAVHGIAQTDRGVVVEVAGASLTASACVVTAPLGVLAVGAITFEPGLPDRIAGPLQRLEMGSLEKIVFRWDGQPAEELPREFLWCGASTVIPSVVDLGDSGDRMLAAAFAGGSAGRVMAAWTDDEARVHLDGLLDRAYGASRPRVVEILRSNWSGDPWSRGSYCFVPVGASPDDLEAFQEPVGRVWFAGEHTDADYYGTVHGAWRSGVRAAEAVLERG